DFFVQRAEAFYKFYYEKIADIKALPNRTHFALSSLERMGKLKAVVTQNIDGLHYAAGSKVVYELHGSAMRNTCTHCGAFYTLQDILEKKPLPTCTECGALIKPDVTLYGEALPMDAFEGALAAIAQSDLLIVGGTSLAVYPAAGLIGYRGGRLVVINRDPTPADKNAALAVTGVAIGDILGDLF
ncbi:MAG: NAD-dependent protein deacylase, partial [Clostridiales bacterium]|nr:NAD-dependent protein deacylase [Clostridiales bacterium]